MNVFAAATDIRREHDAVGRAHADALDHARRAGELLAQVKADLPHGGWLDYLQKCVGLAPRTAQQYMRVAKCWAVIDAARRDHATRADCAAAIERTRGRMRSRRNALAVAHFTFHDALRLVGSQNDGTTRPDRVPQALWVDLSPDEQREIRRILAEVDSVRFVPRTFIDGGVRHGGDVEVVPGAAGAPVYWDIVGGDPKTGRPVYRYSREDVIQSLRQFVEGGRRTVASDLTVDVVRRRLRGDTSLRPAVLPPDAGDVPVPLVMGTTRELQEFADVLREARYVLGLADEPSAQVVLAVFRHVVAQTTQIVDAMTEAGVDLHDLDGAAVGTLVRRGHRHHEWSALSGRGSAMPDAVTRRMR